MTKNWILLLVASLFEIAWVIGLKYSNGFINIKWTVFTAVTYILSALFLGMAVKELSISIAYAIWTGIGTIGVIIFGIFVFNDQISILKLLFISLILIGIIGLKLNY